MMDSIKSWAPTRKFVAALLTGLLTIAGHAIASGAWDTTEWGELVALGTALTAAYVVPNENTPSGVPLKKVL
jgi:hypothetical protein